MKGRLYYAAMQQRPTSLFSSPNPHFVAFDGDDALLLDMERMDYHQSIFLDRRAVAKGAAPWRTPAAPLIAEAGELQAPSTGWIFHMAHCGSTLLARLIDQPDHALILREPPPLRQLAVLKAGGRTGADWQARLRFAHAMAARRFNPSQRTIVKANVPINFILPELAAIDPNAPAILLHFALQPYLLAVLRSSAHRDWIDRVTRLLEPALKQSVGLQSNSGIPERAAALWLAQILLFQETLKTNPKARSLDAEQFLAEPVKAATATAVHFEMPIDGIEKNASGLLTTYSKNPAQPFTESDRQSRQAEDLIKLEADITAARQWITRSDMAQLLPERLERSAFGVGCNLLA